jgi:AcrR family transcriptional regulator
MRGLRLTHGGFYKHFGNKEQLFLEAFEQGLTEVSSKALEAVQNAPPNGQAKALIEAIWMLSMPAMSQVVVRSPR